MQAAPDSPNLFPFSPVEGSAMSPLSPPIPATSKISLISLGPESSSELRTSEDIGTYVFSPQRRPSRALKRLSTTTSLVPDSPSLSPVSLNSSPSKLNLNGS